MHKRIAIAAAILLFAVLAALVSLQSPWKKGLARLDGRRGVASASSVVSASGSSQSAAAGSIRPAVQGKNSPAAETVIRKREAVVVLTGKNGETRVVTNVHDGVTNVFIEFRQGTNRKWLRLTSQSSGDSQETEIAADTVPGVETGVKYIRVKKE